MFKRIKEKLAYAKMQATAAAVGVVMDTQGASLWEYLLVIAIVCIIGAALINVIAGTDGIAGLWSSLYARFREILSKAM